jgi:hypothetical protein
MDKRQKAIVAEFLTVIAVTSLAVVGLVNFKDYVNRSEALQAMQAAGELILEYQDKNNLLPPESYVEQLKREVKGGARMGQIQYRGLFIGPRAEPNEILLYSEKQYKSSFLDDGYVVLFVDGAVKWMGVKEFEEMLGKQQTDFEIHMRGDTNLNR